MVRSTICHAVIICLSILFSQSFFVGRAAAEEEQRIDPDKLSDAIQRAVKLIEKASGGSADERQCFTCHHQALPILAITAAKARGFSVDQENLDRQWEHTYRHLQRGKENYVQGKGQGGKVDTAGYALWALSTSDRSPDEVTDAVTQFLVRYQSEHGRWKSSSRRPPSEVSSFTATYVAVRALDRFGRDDEVVKAANKRRAAVRQWLQESEPKDTEDRVFQLRLFAQLQKAGAANSTAEAESAEKETAVSAVDSAAKALLAEQQADGGWRQNHELASDAYATGTALTALVDTQQLKPSDEAFRRGVRFLVRTQQDDGSWHVVSRSDPFQTYYETSFPHGEDQFISCAASCWATMALLHAVEEAAAANSSR